MSVYLWKVIEVFYYYMSLTAEIWCPVLESLLVFLFVVIFLWNILDERWTLGIIMFVKF